jgi:MFS family permease
MKRAGAAATGASPVETVIDSGAAEPATTPTAARIGRDERRRALAIAVPEGVLAQWHTSLTGLGMGGNAFTYAFALLLGASNAALGVLGALPQLAMTSQIASAWALQHLERRKGVVVVGATLGRLLFLAIAFLPFALEPGTALVTFLVLWGVANVSVSVAGNAWTSWMSDVIPRGLRGRYMSRRNALAGIAGMTLFLGAGIALDAYAGAAPGASAAADARRLAGFAVAFAFASVGAIGSAWLLLRQPEPVRSAPAASAAPGATSPLALARLPLADPAFRRLTLFFACFSFVNGIGNPFWTPYMLEDLGAGYAFVTRVNVVGGLAGMILLPLWGRAVDRFGGKPIIALAVCGTALHPTYYLASAPGFLLPLYLDGISTGILWGGFNTAMFTLLLGSAPPRGREMYYAVLLAAAGSAMAASSVIAGQVVGLVPPVTAFGRTLTGREVLFASVVFLRLSCLPLALRIAEPRARDVRYVVQSVYQLFRGRLTPGGPLAAPSRPRGRF